MKKNTKQLLMEAAIELFKDDLLNEIVKKADEVYEKGLGNSVKAYGSRCSGCARLQFFVPLFTGIICFENFL